ncbi:MAG TPA: tetratricopeptide repeat protein [Tepidisphaeraceae bacterium]|jgi:predicted TPR repeat methyltransferase|nr:tetratricopeptide repeat protein [Tepidisphaeraceae bacterium]
MAQDLLQIALEHHRAGRLTQAQTGYKAVLQNDPANADALHWLGVLTYQAGQANQAIPLLERAAALKPTDAAFQHNLGQAYMDAGRKDGAVKAFSRATAANPNGTESLVLLGRALLARGLPGDASAAIAALRQAMAAGLDSAELHHQLGVAFLVSRRFSEAVAACQAALAKNSNDAMTYYHLGIAHRGAGQIKETRKNLIKALELEPALSQAWCGLAMLDLEAGKPTEAAGLFRRAINANRDDATAYDGLQRALRAAGKIEEAEKIARQRKTAAKPEIPNPADPSPPPPSVADLERRLTLTADESQIHFAMAALMNVFPPAQMPAEAVSNLFDRYAPGFDEHLQGTLEYRAPEQLAAVVRELWDGKPLDILDLGCGTGLCGPLLRPMANTLAGVDLSAGMIEKARARGVYDRLELGNLIELLRQKPRGYDLLSAADVLIYLGDLSTTFEAAAQALRPGGLFVFSVEAFDGNRYELAKNSRRYKHSKPYLEHIASIYGFEETRFTAITLRKESTQPVPGYLIALRLQG